MWSYYGAKTNIAHLYPPPKKDRIIEPFAGSARYSLKHFEHDVVLIDKYDVVIKVWKYLQQCSKKDILGLPNLKFKDKIADYQFDCEGQRLLMGFLIGYGSPAPRNSGTVRLLERPTFLKHSLQRIAGDLHKIKHWQIELGDYEEAQNQEATWFIDPPYQVGGHSYRESNKNIDFPSLGAWCQSRRGQVIVCENSQATWMDFKPMITQNVAKGKNYEVIWLNERSTYDNHQLQLL